MPFKKVRCVHDGSCERSRVPDGVQVVVNLVLPKLQVWSKLVQILSVTVAPRTLSTLRLILFDKILAEANAQRG
ncbi:hypothetical protein J6590_083050 [Homalodisca vitripennis]|nr:hypothetical protein J6590_083050 [Homalodisca vitripennis]